MRQDSTVARALAAEYLLDPRGLSPRVVIDELMSTLAARDAEIERLRELIDDAGKPWILLDPGVPWEGAIDAAMAAACGEIERLRSLVEKRERQLVWVTQHRSEIVVDERGSFLWGTIQSAHGIKFDGTPEGLLAAIDEATAKEAK